MRAKVDQDTCIGCGLCESICPKVFKMNQEGLAEAADADIEMEDQAEAEDAGLQCPVEAITIVK